MSMINQSNNLSGKLAVDVKDMDQLRQAARQNSPEALRESARQFEALFMNMVMKSMRQSSPQDGVFDSEQSRMYTSMLDQQLSQNMAKRGVGLADVLIRQLSNAAGHAQPESALQGGPDALPPPASGEAAASVDGRMRQAFNAMASGMQDSMRADTQDSDVQGMHGAPGDSAMQRGAAQGLSQAAMQAERAARTTNTTNTSIPGVAGAASVVGEAGTSRSAGRSGGARSEHIQAFERRLFGHAREASRSTGIPAKFMLGQAALESGWGRREIRMADGSPSHNLFGIKATGGWKGKVVETRTTEYIGGVPQSRVEKFRAYDSYADAFRDYGRLLSSNPRYQPVMANTHDAGAFARGLQQAGYATDPNYAAKLTSIINNSLSSDTRLASL